MNWSEQSEDRGPQGRVGPHMSVRRKMKDVQANEQTSGGRINLLVPPEIVHLYMGFKPIWV